jgi:putative transposase
MGVRPDQGRAGLGIFVSATTIRTIFAPRVSGRHRARDGPPWRQFLAQAKGIVACDFFTVETVFLKTLYVLVFMHVETRRILGIGVSANPDETWVTQQARNMVMDAEDGTEIRRTRFLLRDRDANERPLTSSTSKIVRIQCGQRSACLHSPSRSLRRARR